MKRLRRYLLEGMALVLPVGATLWALWWLFTRLDRILGGYFESLALGDVEACYHYFRRFSSPTVVSDAVRFRNAATEILHEWHLLAQQTESQVNERHSGRFITRVTGVMRDNLVGWEPNHQLFWRCILTMHSVQLRLAPELDLFAAFRRTFDSGVIACHPPSSRACRDRFGCTASCGSIPSGSRTRFRS